MVERFMLIACVSTEHKQLVDDLCYTLEKTQNEFLRSLIDKHWEKIKLKRKKRTTRFFVETGEKYPEKLICSPDNSSKIRDLCEKWGVSQSLFMRTIIERYAMRHAKFKVKHQKKRIDRWLKEYGKPNPQPICDGYRKGKKPIDFGLSGFKHRNNEMVV